MRGICCPLKEYVYANNGTMCFVVCEVGSFFLNSRNVYCKHGAFLHTITLEFAIPVIKYIYFDTK